MKPTIGLDIDEVLLSTVPRWLEIYSQRTGFDYKNADVWSHYLPEVFEVTVPEVMDIFKEVWLDVSKISLTEKHLDSTVQRLRLHAKVVILTNNPYLQARARLDEEGITYDEYRLHEPWNYDKSLDDDIDVFVDDRPQLAHSCMEKGKRMLLYDRPWNRRFVAKRPVMRIFSLEQAITYLDILKEVEAL